MSYKEEFEMLLERIDERRTLCFRELKHLPVGELHIEKSGKYQQVRRYYKRNEKWVRESVGRDSELLSLLKRRTYYEKEIEILNEDYKTLRDAAALLNGNDFETIVKRMRNRVTDLSFEDTVLSEKSGLLIPRPVEDPDIPVRELELELGDADLMDWAVMPYRANSSYLENKQHIGATGLCYRSRAELNIFEHIIIKRKQPVHYDELIDIDGEWFSPDGITTNAAGKIRLIEYMEMENPEYLRSSARKLEAYRRKGFVPGRNLIILSSETNGFINIPKLDKILDAYLLV